MFGRQTIGHIKHHHTRTIGQANGVRFVRLQITDHPTTAMEIDQSARHCAFKWPNDAHVDVATRARNSP